MTTAKTQVTQVAVKDFIAALSNERHKADANILVNMMKTITGQQPTMWGPSIIGFGVHHYTLANGSNNSICKIGFSPRAQSISLYLGHFDGRATLVEQLGKHKQGKGGCLYINKLDDVNLTVLETMIQKAYQAESDSLC